MGSSKEALFRFESERVGREEKKQRAAHKPGMVSMSNTFLGLKEQGAMIQRLVDFKQSKERGRGLKEKAGMTSKCEMFD